MNHRYDDEDMKIAPDDLSQLFSEDAQKSDDNIELFIRQRELGNTDRARELGGAFVADLLDCVWTKAPQEVAPDDFDLQLKLLFCYVVHRVVEDHAPNSVLAHTVLSSFYDRLDEAEPTLFKAMNGNPAFSLYLLLHRNGDEKADAVGRNFAQLCGVPDNPDCAVIGESGYARFLGACIGRMQDAHFA